MNISLPISLFLYPVIAFAVYWPCLRGKLIFDDNEVLPTAYSFKGWRSIGDAYRGLTVASFHLHGNGFLKAATDEEFERRVLPFAHGENIVLHAIGGMLVQGIAGSLGLSSISAFLTGILYICHPFAVNSVAYITGRASIISVLCGLAAVWAILAGFPWLAIPGFILACWAKEDGVGFLPLLIMMDRGVVSVVLVAILLILVVRYRVWIREWWHHQGDKQMGAIGLPVALPFWSNFYTILTETLIRIPKWFLGFGRSPYHGSGFKPRPVLAIPLLLGACLLLWGLRLGLAGNAGYGLAALLILVGPWNVYLVCPIPDQICEYRNYSMVAAFSLLISTAIYKGCAF